MENNNLNNLPPFYVGQKVVYVGWRKDLVNSIHSVDSISKGGCGCWNVYSSTLPSGTYNLCSGCNRHSYSSGNVGGASSFRPLQESVFPSLTMSRVIEKERELISMN